MAQSQGVGVDEVVSGGIGLAFIAFPTILNEAPGGTLLGLLFFGSLVVAGLTSLISVVEVGISAVRDKTGAGRVASTLVVGVPTAVISCLLMGTTGGIYVLDTVDHFINSFGILGVGAIAMFALALVFRVLPRLARHLNVHGSIRLGRWWYALVGVVVPVVLGYMVYLELRDNIASPYEDYPAELLGVFGWGLVAALPVAALLISLLPWRSGVMVDDPGSDLADASDPFDRAGPDSADNHRPERSHR